MPPSPDWVDSDLSTNLPALRAKGEGQGLEYMVSFPTNARDLGKEIAAFATSNEGTILLGVDNDGTLVGLANAATPSERDQLHLRLQGICHGTIKPPLTPTVRFAAEDGHIVLVLQVPKGSSPVYYSNNIPYLRHITEARPAEPEEVIQLIREWLSLEPSPSRVPSAVATAATRAALFADDLEAFGVEPGLDSLHREFAAIAEDLRAVAVTDDAVSGGLTERLKVTAAAAEAVATFRHYMGRQAWDEFTSAVATATALVGQLYADMVGDTRSPREEISAGQQRLRELVRDVADLAGRAEAMLSSGASDDLMIRLGLNAFYLMALTYGSLRSEEPALLSQLKQCSRRLHVLTTSRFYTDGGHSQREFVAAVQRVAADLSTLANDCPHAG